MLETDDDGIEELMIEVRAGTQGFAQDIAQMRSSLDTTLIDGFERAGMVLERGLLGAIRRGGLGFADFKRIAFNTIDEIAAQAVQNLFSGLPGSGGGVGGLLNLGGLIGSVLGLPGRATVGPVAPGRGYLVGERGPELFVPASAGKVEPLERTARRAERLETPDRPYRQMAAERSPDLRPPVAAPSFRPRDVKVSINIAAPQGASVPQSLRRSSRQLASAVRRAVSSS